MVLMGLLAHQVQMVLGSSESSGANGANGSSGSSGAGA
jgi:hypothetical protein